MRSVLRATGFSCFSKSQASSSWNGVASKEKHKILASSNNDSMLLTRASLSASQVENHMVLESCCRWTHWNFSRTVTVPSDKVLRFCVIAFQWINHAFSWHGFRKLSLDFRDISNILLRSCPQEFWQFSSVGASATHGKSVRTYWLSMVRFPALSRHAIQAQSGATNDNSRSQLHTGSFMANSAPE